jgi:AcrR family transcriptional regulator
MDQTGTSDQPVARRGPRSQRGVAAAEILHAARSSFASRGYDGTTLQGVAQAVGVDTKLVRYYFGSKEQLFAESLRVPDAFLQNTDAVGRIPVDQRGEALVRSLIASWAVPEIALILRSVMLVAMHEETAMEQLQLMYVEGLLPSISEGIPAAEIPLRTGLIVTELLGLTLSRYIYRIDQMVSADDEQIVRAVGATIQRYISGELG